MATSPSSLRLKLSSQTSRFALPRWTREPLLHFVVLGAILFGVDHLIAARQDDPHVILIDGKVDNEARRVFQASRGREPNADELYALRRVWLDNEVLYREGLALELDKGDKAIRERVIFKALSVIDSNTKLPPHDDAVLREWFERNRARYDEPARYDFQEAVLAGNPEEAAVRAFAASLNAGTPGDEQAGLRIFKDRPRANLEQSYGADFVKALETASPGEWSVVRANGRFRVVRLEQITPPAPADYEHLRNVIRQDWTDATLADQRSAAVRALAKKYTVKVGGAAQ
ncbi:MAG: peptidylprolyl isomerase [Steroidobacteraceae bacterium]